MTIEIRDQLIKKGYETKCVNMGCYDVNQSGHIHYLSAEEGSALNNADLQHPVNLFNHAETLRYNVIKYSFIGSENDS